MPPRMSASPSRNAATIAEPANPTIADGDR
ncbi:MAG: hypothetical protein K0Q58_373 [Microbacterium sp.]|jgi:hypothetical protein|nr:hypothetical protein [Microbacterium sp.]